MPLTDITNQLVANISTTEQSSANVPINRSTGNPAFTANTGQFSTYVPLATGVNVIPIPQVPACQLYIRNIDPTGTVIVNWTPIGQASAYVIKLWPGDQILFWISTSNSPTNGITALSLTASANMLVEYFLGG
jgi:hypothetical protein